MSKQSRSKGNQLNFIPESMKLPAIALVIVTVFFLGCEKEGPTPTDATSVPLINAGVHDPAHLIRMGNTPMLFASAIEWSRYDAASQSWNLLGDDLYAGTAPSWDLGQQAYWAPSVIQLQDGSYRLYHSAVYNEDQHGSRIGFARLSGDPENLQVQAHPDFVVESQTEDQAFAIDPAVFFDDDGRQWLVYGSHAAGIVIAELDPQTGLLKENPGQKLPDPQDARFTTIANYGGTLGENNVEAAYIYNHPSNSYYYLFVNWDRCCSGVNSSYNIRVGRSTSPTGPFLDQAGVDLAQGGGTVFLDAAGQILGDSRFIGPGHAGIYTHSDGNEYFSHHFYDGSNNGMPSLAIWHLNWENEWPTIDTKTAVSF